MGGATAAWTFSNRTLTRMWSNSNGGTRPVVAGSLLYVYNPQGGLYVYNAVDGTQLAKLDSGSGHWNSPIVVDRTRRAPGRRPGPSQCLRDMRRS